jgi:hypothetical protein
MVSSLVAAITGRRSSRKNPKNFDPDPPFDPPLGVKAEMLKTEMLKIQDQPTLCSPMKTGSNSAEFVQRILSTRLYPAAHLIG